MIVTYNYDSIFLRLSSFPISGNTYVMCFNGFFAASKCGNQSQSQTFIPETSHFLERKWFFRCASNNLPKSQFNYGSPRLSFLPHFLSLPSSRMIAAPAMASIDGSQHGSTISVVTWFLLVATALAVITRLATKLAISHRLNTDDFVVFSALVRKLVIKSWQCLRRLTVPALVHRPIRCGVYPGTSQSSNQYFRFYSTGKISTGASTPQPGKGWKDSVADLLQSTYAAGLLYIPSLLLAKLSVSLLLRLITPNTLHKKLILGVEIVTVFWAVSSEIAAAFQCHLPVPWKFLGGNTCFDRVCQYST